MGLYRKCLHNSIEIAILPLPQIFHFSKIYRGSVKYLISEILRSFTFVIIPDDWLRHYTAILYHRPGHIQIVYHNPEKFLHWFGVYKFKLNFYLVHLKSTIDITLIPCTFPFIVRGPRGDYEILETDYTSYALVSSCRNLGIFNLRWAWILSRDRTLNPDLVSHLVSVFRSLNLNSAWFRRTDQQNCDIVPLPDNSWLNHKCEYTICVPILTYFCNWLDRSNNVNRALNDKLYLIISKYVHQPSLYISVTLLI